jgi:hypothetical protein
MRISLTPSQITYRKPQKISTTALSQGFSRAKHAKCAKAPQPSTEVN